MEEFGAITAGGMRELDAFFGGFDQPQESIIPQPDDSFDDTFINPTGLIKDGSGDDIMITFEEYCDKCNKSVCTCCKKCGGADCSCKRGAGITKFERMVQCLRDGGFDAEDVLKLLMYGNTAFNDGVVKSDNDGVVNGAGEREVFQEAMKKSTSECYGECAPACTTVECAEKAGYNKDEIAIKPTGPANNTALLSNFDIDAVLAEWKKKFPKFHPCSFSMIDFEKKGDELSTVNIADLLAEGAETFGVVINTDTYQGSGKHWMALFIDLRKTTNSINNKVNGVSIEFFNSTGDREGKIARGDKYPEIRAWVKKMAEQAKQAGLTPQCKLALYAHQKQQTECGVYSLYYIWNRLNGTTPEEISENQIPDEDMHKFRKFLFQSI